MGFGEPSCQADPFGLAFCWQGPSPGGFLSCLGLDRQEFLLGFWGKVAPALPPGPIEALVGLFER